MDVMKIAIVIAAIALLLLSACAGGVPEFVHNYGTAELDQHGHELHGNATPHPRPRTPTPAWWAKRASVQKGVACRVDVGQLVVSIMSSTNTTKNPTKNSAAVAGVSATSWASTSNSSVTR